MLETVLNHLHNWFQIKGAARAGTFIIVSGTLPLDHVLDGQYYRIEGSVFNDGLHRRGDAEDKLVDETFSGRIIPLAIPKAVIKLAEEIKEWDKNNPASDKILAICDALDITPYELLSNVKEEGARTNKVTYRIVVEGTEEDMLLEIYEQLDVKARGRLLGFMEALKR